MKKLLIAISMFLMLVLSVLAVSAVNVAVTVDSRADDGASNPNHDDDYQKNINGTATVSGADSSCTIEPATGFVDSDLGDWSISAAGAITGLRISEKIPVIYDGDEDSVIPVVYAQVYCGATNTATLTVERDAKLIIDKVEATFNDDSSTLNKDGDEIDDIKPGTQMNLEVFLDNDFDKDANNEIAVDVSISCDPNDIDVDDDSDSVDITEDDSDSIEFDLDFVEDDVTDDTYTCTIVAEGTDEFGTIHRATWNLDFTVVKEKYEIQIKELTVNPSSITCDSRDVTVNAKIKNTGSKNDKEVLLELTVPKLGLKKEFADLDLDETDSVRKSFSIAFPESAESGKYDIVAKTYNKGLSLSDTKIISITVPNCNADEPVVVQPPVVITTPVDNEPVVVTPVDTSADTAAEENEETTTGNGMVIALVVLIVLLIAGIVGLLIYLFKA